MKRIVRLVTMLIVASGFAAAQLYSTAETVGKGKNSLLFSPNAVMVSGAPNAEVNLCALFHGLTNRVDVAVGFGSMTLEKRTQVSGIVGANVNIYKSEVVNFAVYNLLNTAFNKRSESSELWWYSAFISSHNLKWHKEPFATVYAGFAPVVPIGDTHNKFFTWDQPQYNLPLGVAIPKGPWVLQVEYNAPIKVAKSGPKVQMFGVGINYAWGGL